MRALIAETHLCLNHTKTMKVENITVQFSDWECSVSKILGQDNRVTLKLFDKRDGELVAIATKHVPSEPIEQDEVIIKDYAENEGMFDALVAAGVIGGAQRYIQSGYVTMPVCKLLI